MRRATITALRIVLALVLLGTLFVQAVMVPLLGADFAEAGSEAAALRVPVLLIVVLGILTVQLSLVCVWILLTMVRRGTVFTRGAFRYVDIIIGAILAAAVLMFALGVVLAPGELVAPGVVLLIGGAALAIVCVALIVVVMRALLAQAVARDAEARGMQAQLDEVV